MSKDLRSVLVLATLTIAVCAFEGVWPLVLLDTSLLFLCVLITPVRKL